MSVSRNMFWFRQDLRLSDQAMTVDFERSQCLFYYSLYDDNSALAPLPPSRLRKEFIQQCLTDLETGLQKHDLKIQISELNPLEEIPLICRQENIQTVYCNRGFSRYEHRLQKRLEQQLQYIGVSLEVLDSERFPWLPQQLLNPKSIFTDYRQRMELRLSQGIPISCKSLLEPDLKHKDNALNSGEHISANALRGGESEAYWRIQNFVRKGGGIESYIDTRNGMLGYEYSSLLSPYLAHGCCTAAQVYEAVKNFESEHGATKSSYWLIFELLWRSYFKWIGEMHGHRIFLAAGYNGKIGVKGRRDKVRFMEWVLGVTNEPLVNACMKELSNTGYMGNRARQIAASYLIHDLEVDWTWGARYFEHMLLDYDACSNYGNWAYLAGVGSDARQSRRFNPIVQQEKYDPDRLYMNYWMGWNAIPIDEEIFERITQ